MDYYIIAIIKGKKYQLHDVGSPRDECDMLRKISVQGYVCKNFRDVMDEMEDLTEIKYMHGKKILFKYNY